MRRCPKCQSTYTDDTLRFCLQDGMPLVSVSGHDLEATVVSSQNEPPPTEVMPPSAPPPTTPSFKSDRIKAAPVVPLPPPVLYQTPAQPQAAPRSSNRGIVIILSTLVIILLLALGAIGAWVYFRESNRAASGNQNGAVNANGRNVTNANTRTSPSPTPSPIDEAAIRQQVTATLNNWAASTRARDLNSHMSYYTDTLETYYQLSNVSSSRVRADRQKAFDAYDSLDVKLSNIKITPDPSGERATVVLDKTWEFSGEEKYSNGSVQQKLTLVRVGGRWLITGERDLQVYYKNSSQ